MRDNTVSVALSIRNYNKNVTTIILIKTMTLSHEIPIGKLKELGESIKDDNTLWDIVKEEYSKRDSVNLERLMLKIKKDKVVMINGADYFVNDNEEIILVQQLADFTKLAIDSYGFESVVYPN